MNKIYAVDFDGTLNTAEYPKLGEPNTELFQFLIKRQQSGDKIILWTCREGDLLQEAVIYCRANGFQKIRTNTRTTAGRFMQIIILTTGTR